MRMSFGMLCARRTAIVAALAGGTMIAILGAQLCADGLVMGGTACAGVIKSGLQLFGL